MGQIRNGTGPGSFRSVAAWEGYAWPRCSREFERYAGKVEQRDGWGLQWKESEANRYGLGPGGIGWIGHCSRANRPGRRREEGCKPWA